MSSQRPTLKLARPLRSAESHVPLRGNPMSTPLLLSVDGPCVFKTCSRSCQRPAQQSPGRRPKRPWDGDVASLAEWYMLVQVGHRELQKVRAKFRAAAAAWQRTGIGRFAAFRQNGGMLPLPTYTVQRPLPVLILQMWRRHETA